MSPPTLKHIADIHLDLALGLPCGTTPQGTTTWFEITGGKITSPAESPTKLNLTALSGGGDYATVYTDAGVVSLDVHFLARQHEGGDGGDDIFRFRNTGFIHLNNPAVAAIMTGDPAARSTEYGQASVVETITCQTASREFGWMNWATMIAQGRLVVKDGKFVAIEFQVFEVKVC